MFCYFLRQYFDLLSSLALTSQSSCPLSAMITGTGHHAQPQSRFSKQRPWQVRRDFCLQLKGRKSQNFNKPPLTGLFRLTRDNCLLGFSPALGVDVIKLLSISRSILLRFEGFSLSSLRYNRKKFNEHYSAFHFK